MKKIRKSASLLVLADKTINIHEMPLEEYNKLLKENITKTYKHAPPMLEASINFETKHIHRKLALSDHTERLSKIRAYMTLKDNQENFHVSTPFILINPCKNKI